MYQILSGPGETSSKKRNEKRAQRLSKDMQHLCRSPRTNPRRRNQNLPKKYLTKSIFVRSWTREDDLGLIVSGFEPLGAQNPQNLSGQAISPTQYNPGSYLDLGNDGGSMEYRPPPRSARYISPNDQAH